MLLATLRDEAIPFARTMTDKPPATLATLKHILRDGDGLSIAEAAAMELAAFSGHNRTVSDGRKDYTAFREKWAPN